MEAVRRKSPGVCIGWLTGVLAHFRLGWVTGVLAHFRFGWLTGVLAHFRLGWAARCNGTLQWKRCGASRPVFALVGSPECSRTSAWVGIGYFNSIRSNQRIRSLAQRSRLEVEHCWDEGTRRLASPLGSPLGSQHRHR